MREFTSPRHASLVALRDAYIAMDIYTDALTDEIRDCTDPIEKARLECVLEEAIELMAELNWNDDLEAELAAIEYS